MKTLEKWYKIIHFRNLIFDGKYEVSNWGNIRNTKTKAPLAFFSNKKEGKGYLKTKILDIKKQRRTLYIHQLVAFFFVEGFEEGKEVNHKDGNIRNNSFTNLEWISHKENCNHFHKNYRREI